MLIALDPGRDVQPEPTKAGLDIPKNPELEDPGMASSPVFSYLTPHNGTLGDCLDVRNPATSIVFLADAKTAEELDFDETDMNTLSQK